MTRCHQYRITRRALNFQHSSTRITVNDGFDWIKPRQSQDYFSWAKMRWTEFEIKKTVILLRSTQSRRTITRFVDQTANTLGSIKSRAGDRVLLICQNQFFRLGAKEESMKLPSEPVSIRAWMVKSPSEVLRVTDMLRFVLQFGFPEIRKAEISSVGSEESGIFVG